MTSRWCGRRPWSPWSSGTSAAGAARDHADRRGRRPDRAGPDHPPREHPGLERIVEERDATPTQRAIREINAGAYAFDAVLPARRAEPAVHRQRPGRGVPDRRARPAGRRPGIRSVPRSWPRTRPRCWAATTGSSWPQLRAMLRDRVNEGWMRAGVSIIDPATTWIDVTVTLARDVVIEPNTQLRGATSVGPGAVVGPDTTLTDVTIGRGCRSGAYPRLRRDRSAQARPGRPVRVPAPRARYCDATCKIGTFVEMKNADDRCRQQGPAPVLRRRRHDRRAHATSGRPRDRQLRRGRQAPHDRSATHVRTGADNMLVAPVTVGDGAYTAAGSVIAEDVPPGALGRRRAVSSATSRVGRSVAGPNTPAAEAAAAGSVTGSTAEVERTQVILRLNRLPTPDQQRLTGSGERMGTHRGGEPEDPDAVLRARLPGAWPTRSATVLGVPPTPTDTYEFANGRDLRPVRGVGARLRRLRDAVDDRADQPWR